MATKQQLMDDFNLGTAPKLAAAVGATESWGGKGSKRFAYFRGAGGELVVVAGEQEDTDVDLALAYGLTYRGGHPLVLILPERLAFPTLQRAPWLADACRPEVHLHDGSSTAPEPLPSTDETIDRLRHIKPGKGPAAELAEAATPVHLGDRSEEVVDLVEWATKHPLLDPAHRQGERCWQCMGQRVLTIRRSGAGLRIRAGIHTTATGDDGGVALSATDPATIQQRVEVGIKARLEGKYHKADEHWLQSVIRHDPTLVGVEQPALREVPAWRPSGPTPSGDGRHSAWGRGYIDLVGIDGHGDLRIVETKLTSNQDTLLFFQGLDYYVWAQAYRDVLLTRLGAARRARTVVHYVIGDDPKTEKAKVSRFAKAQAEALTIPWRVQTVHRWFAPHDDPDRPHSGLLPSQTLPG